MHAGCSHLRLVRSFLGPRCRIRVSTFVVKVEATDSRSPHDRRDAVTAVYNDPMVASLVYRLEAEEAEERIARRRAALEHPSLIRRQSLLTRARRVWARSFRRSGEPG